MQEFYRQALVRLMALLAISVIVAIFCVERSYLNAHLLPRHGAVPGWRPAANTDAERGGRSTVRFGADDSRLRFTLFMSRAVQYPLAAAELLFEDARGRLAPADLSRYSSIAFQVSCSIPNTLTFIATTFDKNVSKPDDLLSYRPPAAFFACAAKPSAVELDLTRLETPQWWFEMFKLDLSRQQYKLDQVAKLAFAATFQSPAEIASTVEITGLVMKGRDYRYLFGLFVLLLSGWSGFAVWFFRRHASALMADVKAKLQKDLPFVAYQQLALEPHRDKEKAAVLEFIGGHYADANLDLDRVVDHTGVNRSKINEILKAELGFTFSGYLNKLRLTEAARLLSDKGTATVAEIAYSVGYANVSYFNKLFKEEYGCTPKAFRAACEPAA